MSDNTIGGRPAITADQVDFENDRIVWWDDSALGANRTKAMLATQMLLLFQPMLTQAIAMLNQAIAVLEQRIDALETMPLLLEPINQAIAVLNQAIAVLEQRIDALETGGGGDYGIGDGLEVITTGSGDGYRELRVRIENSSQFSLDNVALELAPSLWSWLTTKRDHAESIGDGVSTLFSVTHGLESRDVMVQVVTTTTPFTNVPATIDRDSLNTITVQFDSPPDVDACRVLIQRVGLGPVIDSSV